MPKRHPIPRPAGIEVTLANEQSRLPIDEETLVNAAEVIVRDSRFESASISIAIVDDPAMHELNRKYLDHDYPTDVLSFVLDKDDAHLDGEVIASIDTAAAAAAELGVSPDDELLLYVIHGTLHLVGYRDKSAEELAEMRSAEQKYMQRFCVSRASTKSRNRIPPLPLGEGWGEGASPEINTPSPCPLPEGEGFYGSARSDLGDSSR
jgi:probable rRNA maturation factor